MPRSRRLARQVRMRLETQPKIWLHSEIPSQSESHRRRDSAATMEDLAQCDGSHTYVFRYPVGRKSQRFHEEGSQDMPRCPCLSVRGCLSESACFIPRRGETVFCGLEFHHAIMRMARMMSISYKNSIAIDASFQHLDKSFIVEW